jgi:hypothetical protein
VIEKLKEQIVFETTFTVFTQMIDRYFNTDKYLLKENINPKTTFINFYQTSDLKVNVGWHIKEHFIFRKFYFDGCESRLVTTFVKIKN